MIASKVERTTWIYVVILLFAIDAVYALVLLASMTQYVALNVVGIIVDLVAIAGLWSMKKWGAAFTIVASGKGIGQSMSYLQVTYLYFNNVSTATLFQSVIMPCLTIATDVLIVIYLFRGIFANRFR